MDVKSVGRPVISDFINYNKNVGPLQCLWVGYPGTGKSSHALQVAIKCLKRPNETLLCHGDIACEWKHFLRYSKFLDKILILIPAELGQKNIHLKNFTNFDNYNVELEFKYLPFADLDIISHLAVRQVTVVYDDCFEPEDKTALWNQIAWQLISRTELLNVTITYLCHEAGNYYPQTARGKQWHAIDRFCDYFVFFRKRGIRAMLLTQLESEVYDRLRKKCIYKVYRICYPTNRTHSKKISKYILKMKINNYHLFFGDLYNPMRSNKATLEITRNFLMIPRVLIKLNREYNGTWEEGEEYSFETTIKSKHRISLGRQAEKAGIKEGDHVKITFKKLEAIN